MTERDKFIAEETARLKRRAEDLIAQGMPDEAIPMQIEHLGYVWDTIHAGRKWNGSDASKNGAD